jgi:hypothetical protein
MRARRVAAVAVALAASAWAQTPVDAARALVARYHEDPAGLDRARDLPEAALAKDPKVDPSIAADWTVKDAPRARNLLESIKDRH